MVASHWEQVTAYALDVGDHAQIERLAQSLSGKSIDLLINNADIYTTSPAGDFGNADYEAWMRALRINTLAPLKMVQTFMPQIIRSSQKYGNDQQQNGQHRR